MKTQILKLGLTEIKIKKNITTVTHSGNMSNTIEGSVKPNVDQLLGEGAFDRLLQNKIKEEGSADYLYILQAKTLINQ